MSLEAAAADAGAAGTDAGPGPYAGGRGLCASELQGFSERRRRRKKSFHSSEASKRFARILTSYPATIRLQLRLLVMSLLSAS